MPDSPLFLVLRNDDSGHGGRHAFSETSVANDEVSDGSGNFVGSQSKATKQNNDKDTGDIETVRRPLASYAVSLHDEEDIDKYIEFFIRRIRKALDELPETLDETYGRTLLDIDEEKRAFAYRLFQCITVACRPLSVEELSEFLTFDLEGGKCAVFRADWRSEYPTSKLIAEGNVSR
ncbi:hypothetical protein BJV74DRAFT_949632 [Russula compacta]|nr:hypothetical protein BJV74DRAFT_949632 [Russula compacta]